MTRDIEAKTKTYSNISEDEESVVSMDSYSAEAIALKARRVMHILAAESKKPYGQKGAFGPFVSVTEHKQCMRCCLYIPSAQTGKRMVSRSIPVLFCHTQTRHSTFSFYLHRVSVLKPFGVRLVQQCPPTSPMRCYENASI